MKVRTVSIYFGTFLFTMVVSLGLTFVRSIYINRQAVFISAAFDGRVRVMRGLELFGVDVKAPACKYKGCLLPLVAAAWGGEREAVRFLIERGADVNDGGRLDKTPLMMASYFGETEVVKLLLTHGADVNQVNSDGETALDFAKQKGQSSVIRLLRQAGAH